MRQPHQRNNKPDQYAQNVYDYVDTSRTFAAQITSPSPLSESQ